jgi:tetratricopeptide (TPR) repeat protein
MIARTIAIAALAASTLLLPCSSSIGQDAKPAAAKANPAKDAPEKADDAGPEIDPRNFIYTTDEAIDLFLSRIKRNPNDDVTYQKLGELYERKAEETGDLRYYEKAETALRKSLALFPDNHRTQVSLAAVLCSRHQFKEGLELARQALKRKPKDIDALAIAGDALLETGHYAEAESTYQSLYKLSKLPPVLSRLANLADQQGHSDESIKLMAQSVDEIRKAGGSDKEAGWFVSRQAEIVLNSGQVAEAEKLYAAVPPGIDAFHDATAGLARIRSMQGKPDEAITLYEKAIAIGPDPHMLIALGDLYNKIGKPEKATPLFERVLKITEGKNEYLRIRAMFLADHNRELPEALALAQKDFVDRKDLLGFDALAWTLYKNGRFDEAWKALEEALKIGAKDSNLDFHAGMTRLKLGDKSGAKTFLKKALERNPEFSPIHAETARKTLAELP